MKLNEVLIKNKVVNYDSSAPVGNRYTVLDESMNRVISKHATRESAERQIGKLKNSTVILETDYVAMALQGGAAGTPSPGVFPAGQIFPYGANGYAIGLGKDDEIIRFTSGNRGRAQSEAQKFLNDMPEADRTDPDKIKTAAGKSRLLNISSYKQGLNRRIAASEIKSFEALEKIPKIGKGLQTVLTNPYWRGLGRILAAASLSGSLIWTAFDVINDLENESSDDADLLQYNQELRNILVGQISIQVAIVLRIIFGNAKLFGKALNAIKWTVRAAQAGVASTGVGAIPSAISLLVSEAGWLIAGWAMTRPGVQLAMAEWFHGTLMETVLGFAGTSVVGALTALDAALDGEYGTGALRRNLGWPGQSDAIGDAKEKEVVGSSEWAKLVFRGLLFPPSREKVKVPYIAPEQRATLLRQALGLTEEPTDDPTADVEDDNSAPAPSPSLS